MIVVGSLISTPAFEDVAFKATPAFDSNVLFKLRGKLLKPHGEGPFPAVVLLHGSVGICRYHYTWMERLAGWGYVALLVDSLGSRTDLDPGKDWFDLSLDTLLQDAYDAKSYLEGLPLVDPQRIAVMGWEQGGWAILSEIAETVEIRNAGKPFKAAVTFYPYCAVPLDISNSPLLVLMGDQDRWCPADRCIIPLKRKGRHEITLKVYKGAHHCFDAEGMDKTIRGHRLLYDPDAAADAMEKVRGFLKKYLKQCDECSIEVDCQAPFL